MIISKKKFDKAIKEAVENAIVEEQRKMDKYMEDKDNRRHINKSFENINRRLDKAFSDIDRRLTELESQPSKAIYDSGVACNCSKY